MCPANHAASGKQGLCAQRITLPAFRGPGVPQDKLLAQWKYEQIRGGRHLANHTTHTPFSTQLWTSASVAWHSLPIWPFDPGWIPLPQRTHANWGT